MLLIFERIVSAWMACGPRRFVVRPLTTDRLSNSIAMMCHGCSELTYDVQTVMVRTVESFRWLLKSRANYSCLNWLVKVAVASAPVSSLKWTVLPHIWTSEYQHAFEFKQIVLRKATCGSVWLYQRQIWCDIESYNSIFSCICDKLGFLQAFVSAVLTFAATRALRAYANTPLCFTCWFVLSLLCSHCVYTALLAR